MSVREEVFMIKKLKNLFFILKKAFNDKFIKNSTRDDDGIALQQ